MAINSSLGGFQFQTVNGKKQVSTNGGSTWENFSKALSAFGQGAFLYGTLTNTLKITANQNYDDAFLVISGASITVSKISTSGSGTVTELPHNVSGLQLFGFYLKNIKQGDTITITSSTQARFNYAIWY